ncbi:hypothetical protein GCM10009751_24360 [Myceligenerans crystallogenes]|uniref:PPM-type phosphatase domain-containing protein n=1 Tax=Myceligenerans crystallogenes TaxID=316335 RepID=A0ABN2NFC9_9MICO
MSWSVPPEGPGQGRTPQVPAPGAATPASSAREPGAPAGAPGRTPPLSATRPSVPPGLPTATPAAPAPPDPGARAPEPARHPLSAPPRTDPPRARRPMPPSIGELLLRGAATIGVPVFVAGRFEDGMPLLWANEAFEKHADVRFSDVAGRPLSILGDRLGTPEESARMREQLAAGEEVHMMVRSAPRGGVAGWAQVSLTPARAGHDDRVTHWIGIGVDVSEHMERQAAHLATLTAQHRQREDSDLITQTTELLADLEYPYALRDIAELLGHVVRWAGFYVNDDGLMPAEGIDVKNPPSGRGRRHARYVAGDDQSRGGTGHRGVQDQLGDATSSGDATPTPGRLLEIVDDVQSLLDGQGDEPVALHLDIPHAQYSASGWLQRDLTRRLSEEMDGVPRTVVVHPVAGRKSTLGLLVVWLEDAGDAAQLYDGTEESEEVRAVLEVVARRAGNAIDNARLYAREHRLAETLQRAMLPEQADVPGLDVWTYYAPNAEHAQVGGDWYDILQISADVVGLVIGDVVGHDVEAAATMGQLRSVVRSYAFEMSAPGSVLQKVDQLVAGMGIPRSASMVYATLLKSESGSQSIEYSRAGHLPPLLLRGGEVVTLDEGGGALVGFGSRERTTGSYDLLPGDTLLFYTDGLIERRDRSLRIGLEKLLETAAAIQSKDAAGVGEELLARLADKPEDDVAIVVVRLPDPEGDKAEPSLSPRWRRWMLPSEPSSIGRARHAVLRTCQAWGVEESAQAELVVSELVANGVLHGWGHITLRLYDTGEGLRIEVEDSNPAPPVATDGHPNRLGGFGMQIVERLAEWGWRPAGTGKLVWAKLRDQAK